MLPLYLLTFGFAVTLPVCHRTLRAWTFVAVAFCAVVYFTGCLFMPFALLHVCYAVGFTLHVPLLPRSFWLRCHTGCRLRCTRVYYAFIRTATHPDCPHTGFDFVRSPALLRLRYTFSVRTDFCLYAVASSLRLVTLLRVYAPGFVCAVTVTRLRTTYSRFVYVAV